MEDLKEPATATPVHPARPSRRWSRLVLYVLATVGALALALIALAYWLHAHDARKRVTIDEAAVIDDVMGQTYGKYSAAKKGWLYVGEDSVTYLMRVVQQAKIPDGTAGDELYFVASGAAVNGDGQAVYGVFYVHPDGKDGGLAQENTQVRFLSNAPVKPEQVRFEALSDNLWGWVVKTRWDAEPDSEAVTTMNTVLAPHDGQIAVLGEFLAARDAKPEGSCEDAKAAYDAWLAQIANTEDGDDGGIPPTRCDKRRWTYRTATVNGKIPVPITVTAGGTLDDKPVEAQTWKLMFDTRTFSYDIPPDLQN
ncbi:hypothetical protein [Massilia orientalis]|uniref:Uncharacterized protein n=1 Tax=Massilia orientalis TaxID=3050128 RepID=A0ACC7M4D8_9BURK|nr:hypothetical protein [Massilia sp. YIM B02787]